MEEAYRLGDHEAVAQFAAAASAYLDAEGRHREAIAEVEYGLVLTNAKPAQQAQMLRIRAWFELTAGDPATARISLDRARVASSVPADPEAVADLALRVALTDVIAVEAGAADRLAALTAPIQSGGLESLAALCKLWLGVARFNAGSLAHAAPWCNALGAHGAAQSNRWRVAEAQELARTLRLVREPAPPCAHPDAADPGGRGYIAEWLHAGNMAYSVLRFRGAGDSAGGAWSSAFRRLPAGYTSGGDGFVAALGAHLEGRYSVPITPPDTVTLLNAGSALASAEAVAIAGTQSAATAWATWFATRWPASLRTAVEWPASSTRVHGLLLARSGNLRGAVVRLRDSVRWTKDAGFEVEHAVSLIQLSELLALAPGGIGRQEWSTIRSEGRLRARALGVDAAAVADAAVSAASLGKFDTSRPRLTPREVEVLELFKTGQTYRGAGTVLGLDWRTVQTHAKNIYAKLEVKSKTGAVTRASELGLL